MRNEQPIKRMEDWSKFEWPAENYDYKKDGRLIWTDEIYNVIDAIYQNKIDGILLFMIKLKKGSRRNFS